jgi:hypothetical protein
MAMHGACDYTVIHQGKLETGPSQALDKAIPFTIGSNAVLNVHSILTFTIGVSGGPVDIKITMNDQGFASYHLTDGYFATLNKVMGGGVLQHGTNRIRFHLTAEDYVSLFIEDLALWWFKNSLE